MITAIIPFQIAGEHRTCEVQYDSDDPYAFRFLFNNGVSDAQWLIGRDLLAEGLNSEIWVGEGDIRIRRNSHHTVEVSLDSHEGLAVVTVPRNSLKNFIKRSSTVVDFGKESNQYDWDELDAERALW